MRSKNYLALIGIILIMFIFQMLAIYLNWGFERGTRLMEYGLQTTFYAGGTILSGIASGFCLALALFAGKQRGDTQTAPQTLLYAAILGIIPLFTVVTKLLIAAFGVSVQLFFLSLLRPVSFEIYEWMSSSLAPPFWLGVVIGWLVRRWEKS